MRRYLGVFISILIIMVLALNYSCIAEQSILVDAVDDACTSSEVDLNNANTRDAQGLLENAEQDNLLEGLTETNTTEIIETPSAIRIGVKERFVIDTTGMDGYINFKSKKTKIASVSKDGVIKGKKAGKTQITVTQENGEVKTINVTVANAPKKVKLNCKTIKLTVGEQYQLFATLPKKTASYKMMWSSSNMEVATVDEKGLVCANAPGTTNITVKSFNGKKATCKVTVNAPIVFNDLDYKELSRNPDSYEGMYFKFSGYIGWINEEVDNKGGYTAVEMGVFTNEETDDDVYIEYNRKKGEKRFLKDDVVVVYGRFIGLYTYTTIEDELYTIPRFELVSMNLA